MSFEHQSSVEQGVHLICLKGRIDSASAADFEQAVQPLFAEPGRRVAMDFAQLEYISSAGLRVVLMAAKRARQSAGQLLLCALPPHVHEVFEISGFMRIIDALPGRAEALQRLAGSA